MKSALIPVSVISERLAPLAYELARELLPNGHRAGDVWKFSGIADTGRSASAWLHLSGRKQGRWTDAGNAMAGEEKGDLIDLLRLKLGLADQAAAVAEAKRRLGIEDGFTPTGQRRISDEELALREAEARARAEAREAAHAADREKKSKRARHLYLSGTPIAGTPAEAYLTGRGIEIGAPWPNALRFQAETWCADTRDKRPAMLAAIFTAQGVQIGVHRTYLQACPRRGWTKLDIADAKKVMGPMWGGFVPISKGSSRKPMAAMPQGEAVYVTEGIEDALVVRMMKPEARVIAAISLGNMGAVVLPEAAKELVMVCDRDQSEKAQLTLERSIGRQQARGLAVRVVMPPQGVKDMNDWWNAVRAQRRVA
jgi:hypothetical protein